MRYLFSVLIISLFNIPIPANHSPVTSFYYPDASGIDELISTGLEDMYNLKFEDAKTKFRQAQGSYPDDIKGYFYESMIYFHTAMPSRDEETFEKYVQISGEVIDRCEDMLDKNENNIEALYYKGQSLSYRSLLMLSLNKSLLKAASNGNEGYRILSAVIERDPGLYDAYMGLGLYKIAIGYVPEKFQWLLSIIGFDGDISEGKKLLLIAKDKGKFTKVEAQVYLSLFSLREREEDTGETEQMLKNLVDRYPASPLFRLFYSNILQQTGKQNEAIVEASKALELNINSLQNEIRKGANFVLGMSYFRKNDFVNAVKYLEEHLKYVHREDRYNISTFHTGIAYEMMNNRSKALKFYRKARTDFIEERDGDADRLFYQYSQKLINKKLNEFDSLIVIGMNLRYSSEQDDALKIFNKILISDKMSSLDDNDKVRLFMETGHCYTYDKKDDIAIDYFTRCTRLYPVEERWMIPHAYFELGKIYSRKGNYKKAEEMFDEIFEYSDFVFRSFLEIRLKNYREK